MGNIFYGHATRLKERNVTEAEVEKVIADPDITLPTRKKGRVDVMKRVNGRLIRVVYREGRGGDRYIVTA
ncbi:MAG: DUF4258 domain-containing protein, partial [Actinomycetota bacterium]